MLDFLLNQPFILRVRRNHALEHATAHILNRRYRNLRLVGRSTYKGFTFSGNLSTEAIFEAAQEALSRLKAGQWELAIYPTCGTNFVTGGALAGMGAFIVLTPRRRNLLEWLSRLPLVLLVSTIGFILGRQLGGKVQSRITTEARMGDLRIVSVVREERGPFILHHVRTEG